MSDIGAFTICGLVGMCGDLNQVHEKAIRTLLILDSLRGEDSTGIAAIAKYQGGVKLAKQVGDPFQLFDHKTYDKAFIGFQRAIIGHNRYATTGGVSRNNAHPFENRSLVGAHNGTLRNKHALVDPRDFVVDSENLYHHMDKLGLKDAMSNLDGAWALTWWNKDTKTMNFLRNKERPLYMCWSKDAKVLFWASEAWMLEVALDKHSIDHQDIWSLKEDTLFSMTINDQGIIGKPHISDCASGWKPYVAPVVAITKKEEPAAATPKKLETTGSVVALPTQCDTSYISKRVSSIETLSILRDSSGCRYVSCFDPDQPYYEIRLYARPNHPIWDLVGCSFAGTLSGWCAAGKSTSGYYKVAPDNIEISVPEEIEADAVEQIMGPSGKFISKETFHKEYAQCDWCTASLVFGDANRFTTGGQCVCPSCSKSKAVLEHVNLM